MLINGCKRGDTRRFPVCEVRRKRSGEQATATEARLQNHQRSLDEKVRKRDACNAKPVAIQAPSGQLAMHLIECSCGVGKIATAFSRHTRSFRSRLKYHHCRCR
jgi:hypothetical protein